MTPAATSPQSQQGGYKRSARNYLLDSRFQLKYSGFLVLVAIVISGVMGAVLYETTLAVVGESSALVEESKKVSEVSRMNIRDLASDSPELLTEFNREADAHDKALSEQQARLIHGQQLMIESLVGGLALMVVFIGLLGIYFTHKVAGPIYKMKRLLKQVGDGHLHVDARLRRGDELTDFFETFTQMVQGLRQMGVQAARGRRGADQGPRGGGSQGDAAAALGRVRDAMNHALEPRA